MSGRSRTRSFDELYREIASLPWTIELFEARDARPLMVATARDDQRPIVAPFGVEVPLATFWLPPEEPHVGANL